MNGNILSLCIVEAGKTSLIMEHRIERKFTGTFLYIGEEGEELIYDVSGYENLKDAFSGRVIEEEKLVELINELSRIGIDIENRNLDINGLLASPEFIYLKIHNLKNLNNILFIYNSGKSQISIDSSLMSLAEFLIEKVDYENQNAVNIAYGFYSNVYKGDYIFDTSLWK